MLHGVLRHEFGQGSVSFPESSRLHIVYVGALHAKNSEYLILFEEGPPLLLTESYSKGLLAETHGEVIEVVFLDDLQTEDLLALSTSRIFFELSPNKTGYHSFESDTLPSIIYPHLGDLPDMRLSQIVRNIPIVLGHITQTIVTNVNFCIE
jgi:hypothetical protein